MKEEALPLTLGIIFWSLVVYIFSWIIIFLDNRDAITESPRNKKFALSVFIFFSILFLFLSGMIYGEYLDICAKFSIFSWPFVAGYMLRKFALKDETLRHLENQFNAAKLIIGDQESDAKDAAYAKKEYDVIRKKLEILTGKDYK